MNDSCKVSIITVVYNGADTIEQTILSVLGQTYKNIEYIIIDGLSTDGTRNVVEKYMDSISCFVSEADNGLYDAMNKGIQYATGEIIGIINSDDWYAEDAVEKIVNLFGQKDVDLVYGNVVFVYPDGREKLQLRYPLDTIWYKMAVLHPAVFVKKNVYDSLGTFDLKYMLSADYDLLLRFYCNHVKFGFVDAVIAYFRLGGLSTKLRNKGIEERKTISQKYIDTCPNKRELSEKLDTWYKGACFTLAIRNHNDVLLELLYHYFQEKPREIIIFGTGIWGERCYECLNNKGIQIIRFMDNDSRKWGGEFHGIKIDNPKELIEKNVHVLVAVKDAGEEIKRQLCRMGYQETKCVSLTDLADVFSRRHPND